MTKPSNSEYAIDWADLAFGSKKQVQELNAIFIAAPREVSVKRFTQLIKTYLPKSNIILGIAKQSYVHGLENQPQFKMLELNQVKQVIASVNARSPHKIYTFTYFQRDLPFVIEKIQFKRAIFVNGSWYHAFHLNPVFYMLLQRQLVYELVSPFADEEEAKTYAKAYEQQYPGPTHKSNATYTQSEMFLHANEVARRSFAYSEHQIGVALGRQTSKRAPHSYQLLLSAHNRVVPYETYAMHHGASRERNFSPMNDLNHYDVNHAEVELLLHAQKQNIDLTNTSMFINLLPCPPCSRMISRTGINEIFYQNDHSNGYAVTLLEASGKTLKRIVGGAL